MKVLILKGLPASGKSTFAKSLLANRKENWIRLNKDDARLQYFNSDWNKKREEFVLEMRDVALSFAMMRGYNIVIDDTNFSDKHENKIRKEVEFFNNSVMTTSMEPLPKYEVEVKYFDVDVEECIKRDLKRPVSVGEKVIRQMYDQYLKPKKAVYIPPPDKPEAILCDIDGTLAHIVDRSPYDWGRVGEDSLDSVIADILRVYSLRNPQDDNYTRIILMSGRDAICRPQTESWLRKNNVKYDELYMRSVNDKRKDTVIKKELFNNHIKDNYNIKYVLDDRESVVRMWREDLGLKCLQVEYGDF